MIAPPQLELLDVLEEQVRGVESPFLEGLVDAVAAQGNFVFELGQIQFPQAWAIGNNETTAPLVPVAHGRQPPLVSVPAGEPGETELAGGHPDPVKEAVPCLQQPQVTQRQLPERDL